MIIGNFEVGFEGSRLPPEPGWARIILEYTRNERNIPIMEMSEKDIYDLEYVAATLRRWWEELEQK